ncbi:hypothetical protein LOTGIDRAFT_239035 [Lottia gigantea]|uniref:Uncharacterized protein n=1 Tax=Lottia gigantea TaxID=225164 RepID=V4A3R0_LOTGI|nr:hypothetical protein LOTGIDRAFT_239035 [Lottia gigantea]ESO98533.1 hypothetical protein LOTGIDRAFT_239035 [Lottia gigantea]
MKILVLLLMFSGLVVGWEDAWEYWLKTLDGHNGDGPGQGEWPGPKDEVSVHLEVPTLKPYILQATCDRIMTLYVNGKREAYSLNWAQVSQIELPEEALVAIQCKGFGNTAGIFAKFTPELPEDNNWLCSRSRSSNWYSEASQSEGTWNEPVAVEHQSLVSVSTNRWFWLPRQGLARFYTDIYCRIKLKKRVPPRPKPKLPGPLPKPNPGTPTEPSEGAMGDLGKLVKLRPTLNYIFSSLYKINHKLDNLPDQITYDLKYPKRHWEDDPDHSKVNVARSEV